MTETEAKKLAEPIVKSVVNLLSEKNYKDISKAADLKTLSISELQELIEGYLEINELSRIDPFGVDCNFHPKYEYQQLACYIYKDGSGFCADYDLTTDSELNDLTLQMEFLFTGAEAMKAKILDVHVL